MSENMKVSGRFNKKVIIIAAAAILSVLALMLAITVPKQVQAQQLAEQLDLGDKYVSELDYEQAIAAYLKAIEIDPKCEEAYLALADIYIEMGELEKAEEILQKAEKALKGDTEKTEEKKEEVQKAKKQREAEAASKPTLTSVPELTLAPTDIPEPTPTNTSVPTPTNVPVAGERITGISKEDGVVGNIVSFGVYEQDNNLSNGPEGVEWVVLAVEDGRALLLSKYGLDAKPYHEKDEACTWETSTIREWLNGEFFNMAFRTEEQQFIQTVTVSTPDDEYSGTSGGNDTQDKIFLLSREEVERYRPIGEKSPATMATAYARKNGVWKIGSAEMDRDYYGNCAWWLRASTSEIIDLDAVCAEFIVADGKADEGGILVGGSGGVWNEVVTVSDSCVAVRPALWVAFDDKAEPQEITVPVPTKMPAIKDIAEKEVQTGDIVLFGSYEQDGITENGDEQIEWIVLGTEGKKALLLSRSLLDMRAYVEFNEDDEVFWERKISWETSSLREWLNAEFYDAAFTDKDKEAVLQTTLNDGNGVNTLDYVFLLSVEEAKQYFAQDEYLLDEGRSINTHRVAIPTKKANVSNDGEDSYYSEKEIWWFLRSQGDDTSAVAYVNQNGIIVDYGIWIAAQEYVRPAVWVDLSMIDE